MEHVFKVGGQYRNRKGEYTVLKIIEPDMMIIRYANGKLVKTPIAVQARIWENLQLEEEIEEELAKASSTRPTVSKTGSTQSAKGKWGEEFQGLLDTDFKPSTEGTTWRARNSLGGLLARKLSTLSGREFESHAIYRRAEVHVVQPQSFDETIRLHEAKFFLRLNAGGVRHGFYVEKNWGEMDHTWDWLRFFSWLKECAAQQDGFLWNRLTQIMAEHNLQWEAQLSVQHASTEPSLYLTASVDADGKLAMKFGQESDVKSGDWHDFIQVLEQIKQEEWCDLYLVQQIEKQEAMNLGVRLADRAAEIWHLLLPIYLAAVQRTSPISA